MSPLTGHLRRALLLTTGLLAPWAAQAQLSGLSVVSGGVTVTNPTALSTVIHQTTPKAILNWQSFGVASGTSLQVIEPGSGSIELERVLGGGVSCICGSLSSNGQVWILNPNGVMFGAGSSVNVFGLLVTTSDITNQNFLAGNGTSVPYVFGSPSPNANAAIQNQGAITVAGGGAAVLAGAQVNNQGLIQATLGKVVLAGASAFAVDFTGDKLISFQVTAPVTQTPTGPSGNAAAALVSNSGTISAQGGTVMLTASAARSVLDDVINMSGTVEATTAHEDNGEIVLDAGPGGTANVSGTLDVSGKAAGQTGGTVKITGDTVALAAGATIDASGDAGGGTVLIGGDLHGAGPLANALSTTVAQGATINASAITSGNGGTVAVWSDQNTVFNGAIIATGGAQGGNGGYVETSSAQSLGIYSGTVDALAPQGQVGTWLLDPANITVVSQATAVLLDEIFSYGDLPGQNAAISASLIDNAQANVRMEATDNITVDSAISMVNPGVGLSAFAGNTITVNAGITTIGGAISLNANSDGTGASGSGSIVLAAPLNALGTALNAGAVTLTIAGGTGTITTSYTGGPAITGAAVTLSADEAVSVPELVASGGLSVTAPGITQSGALSVAGTTTLDAAGNDVTLANAGNSFGGSILVTADNATIAAASPVTLGASTVADNLSVTAPGISQSNTLAVAGTTTLDAAGNSVTLFDNANSFGGSVLVTADDAIIAAANPVTLGASTVAGNLSVTAPGITQSGALDVAGTTTLYAAADAITLANAGNDFGTISVAGGGDVTITTANAVTIGSVTADSFALTAGGTISLAGAIETDAAIAFNQPVWVTADSSITTNGHAITFGATLDGSVTPAPVAFLVSESNIATNSDLDITDVTLVEPAALTLDAGTGSITVVGRMGGVSPLVDLTIASAGAVDFESAGTENAASLTVTASTSTSFNGPLALTGGVTLGTNAGNVSFEQGLTTGAASVFANTGLLEIGSTATDSSTIAGGLVHTAGPTDVAGTVAAGPVASFGPLTVLAAATIDTTGGQTYAGPIALQGNAVFAAAGAASDIAVSGTSDLSNGFGITLAAGGNITVSGSLQNAGMGAITLVAGWDGVAAPTLAAATPGAFGLGGGTVTIGGASAAGDSAVGSAGGSTTVAAANLDLSAVNGFAQLGYVGGGATGNITADLTGQLAMNGGAGAGDYAQIGHGGARTSGSESGAIDVAAVGNVTLTGGSGAGAYVQIGHGGWESNAGATVAFSDTGAITVSGADVALDAGAGDGAYAQIGHGGLNAGDGAVIAEGSIGFSGTITVTATSDLTVAGDGTSAYAQIGNGGDQSGEDAILGPGGTISDSGNINVTVGSNSSNGSLTLVGDAYAQIGNGGYSDNLGSNAPGGVGESGTIDLAVLGQSGSGSFAGGNTGPWAYAQVGNGDASDTGVGNVSGNIDISMANPPTLINGTAAPAWMWNATGAGTVSGTTQVDGTVTLPPGVAGPTGLGTPAGFEPTTTDIEQPQDNNNDVDLSAFLNNSGGTSNGNGSDVAGSSPGDIASNVGGPQTPAGPAGAIEQMTGDNGGLGGGGVFDTGSSSSGTSAAPVLGQEADGLSMAVASSLSGKPGVPHNGTSLSQTCTQLASGGNLLCVVSTDDAAAGTPVGVQPAEQPYSSWGNQALWQ